MSTRHLAAKSLSKGMDIVVVDAGSDSSADGDNVKVDTSHQGHHLQEVSYVDVDCDTKGEDVCQIPGRQSPEQFVTRIPTKVEPKTLTYMAKRPAVDIEFQDLTYSVRNPGRRTGKLQLACSTVIYLACIKNDIHDKVKTRKLRDV
jgi:hypothetical protein